MLSALEWWLHATFLNNSMVFFPGSSKIVQLLAKYHLPVDMETDYEKVFEILKMDKKRNGDTMDFILLNKIGEAVIKPIQLEALQKHLKEIV
jgi:3-dehydroquinate synthetase